MINWLTLDELSRHLKLSRASLYKMAQAGQIPAVKIGRSWRFDPEKIDLGLIQSGQPITSDPPWQDSLRFFIRELKKHFKDRFVALWLFGSWARGEAKPGSDIDLLVVLKNISKFSYDFSIASRLAYEATFDRKRPFVFSSSIIDRDNFLTGVEPLLLNVRLEGQKVA